MIKNIDGYIIGAETPEALQLIEDDRSVFVEQKNTEGVSPEDATREYNTALEGLYKIHEHRTREATVVPAYRLVELPDQDANTIHERIAEAERIASPSLTEEGYRDGSAKAEDDLLVLDGGRSLLSAEHATHQMALRKDGSRTEKGPDWGVAGLGVVLHEDTASGLVVARGRQTGNANGDENHPLKDQLGRMIDKGTYDNFLSLHGMRRGNFNKPDEPRAFDIFVGAGNDDPLRESAADLIKSIAKEYGLRVGVNQWFTVMGPAEDYRPKLKTSGPGYARDRFGASKPSSTRSFAEAKLVENGRPGNALQVELSSLLRFNPIDAYPKISDPKRAIMGVYTGYLVIKQYLDSVKNGLPLQPEDV